MITFRLSYDKLDYKIQVNRRLNISAENAKEKLNEEIDSLKLVQQVGLFAETSLPLFLTEQSGNELKELIVYFT